MAETDRKREVAAKLLNWARSLGRVNSRRGDKFFSEQELLLREAASLLAPPYRLPPAEKEPGT